MVRINSLPIKKLWINPVDKGTYPRINSLPLPPCFTHKQSTKRGVFTHKQSTQWPFKLELIRVLKAPLYVLPIYITYISLRSFVENR